MRESLSAIELLPADTSPNKREIIAQSDWQIFHQALHLIHPALTLFYHSITNLHHSLYNTIICNI